MAGLEDFVQSLLLGQQAKQEITAADPYARGSNFFNNQLGGSVLQAAQNPTYSTKDKLIAGLVTGLIGGGFDGLSTDYQGRAKSAYDQVLTDSMAGTPTAERPSVLDKSIFSNAQNQGSVFRTMQALKQADAERQLLGEVAKARMLATDPAIIAGKASEEGSKTLMGLRAKNDFYRVSAPAAGIPAPPKVSLITDPETGEAVGTAVEQPAAAVTPTAFMGDPDSPQYKQREDIFNNERALANDFIRNPVVTDYQYKEQGARALAEAYLDTAGTSDFELLRRVTQMIEPGLAVRQDDQDSLQQAASIMGMSLQKVKAMAEGQTSLDPNVRKGIMRIAKRALDTSVSNYNRVSDNYATRAKGANIDPSRIVIYDKGKSFQELFPNLKIDADASTITPEIAASYAQLRAQGLSKEEAGAKLGIQ